MSKESKRIEFYNTLYELLLKYKEEQGINSLLLASQLDDNADATAQYGMITNCDLEAVLNMLTSVAFRSKVMEEAILLSAEVIQQTRKHGRLPTTVVKLDGQPANVMFAKDITDKKDIN